jgi:hypothetical protein
MAEVEEQSSEYSDESSEEADRKKEETKSYDGSDDEAGTKSETAETHLSTPQVEETSEL